MPNYSSHLDSLVQLAELGTRSAHTHHRTSSPSSPYSSITIFSSPIRNSLKEMPPLPSKSSCANSLSLSARVVLQGTVRAEVGASWRWQGQ